MARKVLKVLIADDERIVRENMRQYIPWASMGMEVVDAVENGALAPVLVSVMSSLLLAPRHGAGTCG